MKPAKIRGKIRDFLDQCPEASDVEGMLKNEFKWIQKDGMIAVLHHLRKNPPLEIHGNCGSAKNLKLWRVSVTPEVHQKLLDLTVLGGCSMSRVVRLALNDGILKMRTPILPIPRGSFKKVDDRWCAELKESGVSGQKVTLAKRDGSEKLVMRDLIDFNADPSTEIEDAGDAGATSEPEPTEAPPTPEVRDAAPSDLQNVQVKSEPWRSGGIMEKHRLKQILEAIHHLTGTLVYDRMPPEDTTGLTVEESKEWNDQISSAHVGISRMLNILETSTKRVENQ